jgi:ubiquinone/menaquinone biosynthesis C-methylase UbiE
MREQCNPMDTPLDRILSREPDLAYVNRMKFLLENIHAQKNDKILDCGCGRGWQIHMLLQQDHHHEKPFFVGIDQNSKSIAEAKRKVTASFICGDVEALPFADETFNKVIFSEVLEHVKNPQRVLSEIRRVLKVGGILLITVPNEKYPFLYDPVNRILETTTGRHVRRGVFAGIWTEHLRLYAKSTLIRDLKNAGFHVEHVRGATYWTIPGSPYLLYGIGKSLLDKGFFRKLYTRRFDRYGDRYGTKRKAGFGMFRWINQLNSRDYETSVCIHCIARKI